MAFGDAITTHADPGEADWIAPALGAFGTVGGLVPGGYEAYALLDYRAYDDDRRSERVQEVLGELAARLASETSTPDTCFFAIWEGYGFGSGATAYAWQGDASDRREMEQVARDARRSDAERLQRVTAALSTVPAFELPNRRYYLVAGSVASASRITRPDGGGPQTPDLWWPRDRRWFVGGDTDLEWCYVGGPRTLIDSIRRRSTWRTQAVAWETTNFDAGRSV